MIITQDEKKNIFVGDLVVKNKDDLREVRDFLIENRHDYTNYHITTLNLRGFTDVLNTSGIRKDDVVIRQYINSIEEDECEYTKEFIRCVHLNSILLFTSLLGELDATPYDSIAKQFISSGIIKCLPLETIWDTCSRSLVESMAKPSSKLKKQDFKIFRAALKLKLIEYQVSKVLTPADLKEDGVYQNFDLDDIQQILINNVAILGDKKTLSKLR